MSFMGKVKNYFVGEDEIEQEVFEPSYSTEEVTEPKIKFDTTTSKTTSYQGGTKHMRMDSAHSLQIVLARPKDFSEVKSIGDDLKEQKTVLLNLELVKSDDANRILDFLSGVAYAKDADIKMMATKTFAIMPPSVGFEGVDLMSELESNGYNF